MTFSHYNLKKLKKKVAQTRYSQALYDQFLADARPSLACPHCDNTIHLKTHGHYWRNLYFLEERCRIEVTRMRCLSCTKTFVVLPPEVIPHKRYAATIVIEAVKETYRTSSYAVESVLNIAKSLLDHWLTQFKQWYLAWVTIQDAHQQSVSLWSGLYALMDPMHRFMQVNPTSSHRYHRLPSLSHTLGLSPPIAYAKLNPTNKER